MNDFELRQRAPWGAAYIGDGNYSSGEFPEDPRGHTDYGYAGFNGDVGFDDIGDQRYGGGRYSAGGPDEQSDAWGSRDFAAGRGAFGRLERDFAERHRRIAHHRDHEQRGDWAPNPESRGGIPVAPGWSDAPDFADPSGFRTFSPPAARSGRTGPKNYRRSDERIHDDIYLRLLSEPRVDSSDMTVEVHEGVATLSGSVPARGMKHAIEDLVAQVRGVTEVDNRLRVVRHLDPEWPRESSPRGSGDAAHAEAGAQEAQTQGELDDPLKYSSAGS